MRSNSDGAAAGDILSSLLNIAHEMFGRHVTGDDNFLTLGSDSISAIMFVMRLEDLIGADIDTEAFFGAANFAAAARTLVSA